MRKVLLLTVFLLTCLCGEAITVKSVIHSGTVVCDDSWGGYLQLSKSQLANAESGDVISVRVVASSENTSIHPLVDFRNGSWKSVVDYSYISDLTLPTEVTLTLTDDIVASIRGEKSGVSAGLVITGCGVTFDCVTLKKEVDLVSTDEVGDAATNIWKGNETISWATGANNSVKIDKSKFSDMASGMKLRMTFTELKMNGVARILHNWTAFPSYSNAKLTTDCGNYFEYSVGDEELALLQVDGLRVSGIGYNLVSVDIIDPTKEYSIIADINKADIRAWEKGDGQPHITLDLTSLQDKSIEVPVEVSLMTDMWEDYSSKTETVTLEPGKTISHAINFDLEPGFYRMTVNAAGKHVCTYMIGCRPTEIVSPDDAQSDFWTFWDGWKEKLATIPVDAELTELPEYSTSARKVYEVKMMSAPDTKDGNPVAIYGYWAEPTDGDKHPVIIRYQGTDNGQGTPKAMNGDDLKDWCELTISTRGQMLSRVKAQEAGEYVDYYGTDGFYAYNFGNTDTHYYRAAYLDCVRAIDFIASRKAVDMSNIFAAGGSQGGCFTYVAAGLDNRLKAIAPSITGHADFPDTKKIVTWPTNVFTKKAQELGLTDEEVDKFNSYFDTKNFASRITCPVITNFSLQDHTDGPHLNIAPYNLLTNVASEDKAYSINPFKGHATADDWDKQYMEFFNKYILKFAANPFD